MTLLPTDYRYDCAVVRVIDGDTLEADLSRDVGFRCRPVWRQRLRILGIDCPEITGATRAAGQAAAAFARDWLAAEPLTAETVRQDSFGRWLAHVRRGDGTSLADALREAGHGD